jgi:nucleotide-binding universal stress UspA family protein
MDCGLTSGREDNMKRRRLLVPVDFSPASLAALKYAAQLGDPKSAEVIVLFVVEPITVAPVDYGYAVANFGAVFQEQQRGGRLQLERLGRQWRRRLPKLRTLLMTGSAATSIVAAAKKLKVDMIVIATHGRTGLKHLFLGSVAERVVRTATCPVLTVRSRPRAAGARRERHLTVKRGARAA